MDRGEGAIDAVPSLIQALNDQNEWVHSSAVQTLGSIGSKDAVPSLMQALKDQNIEAHQRQSRQQDLL